MSPVYVHWWKGVPACPCAVCPLQSILQQKWFWVQSIAKMVGVTFNEQIQECLSTLHLCWPLFSHSYNSLWGAKKDMALGRGPWKESLNRYPRWDTLPHFLSLFCLHFPCPLYAKWCKCFLGDQGESLLAVSLSLYYEKKCCGIRGSTLFHSGFDGVEAMSLFTYLFCFLLSFVCCQCPWHWLLHQQTYFQNLFFSESILFFFFPFLCVKDMYWLCGIPVASCEWCMNWKIFAWYTVGIQKVLCSHCCALLFSIYTDTQ